MKGTGLMGSAVVCMAVALAVSGCGGSQGPAAPGAGAEPSAAPAAPVATPADTGVVVEVNGVQLTRGELNTRVGQVMRQQGAGLPPEMRQGLQGQAQQHVVDGFVSQQVLLQAATQAQISVTAGDIDEAVSNIVKQLPPGMTLEQAAGQMGLSSDKVRYDIEADLKIRKLLDGRTAAATNTTEDQIEGFYKEHPEHFAEPESVHVRHILVKLDEKDDDAAKAEKMKKVEGLRKQLDEGADFAELARANSDCPSKEKGGDLGDLPRGRTVKPFEDAAFAQEVNAIGPVVTTEFGYHVIQVLGKKESRTVPLTEVHDKISQHLGREQKQKAVSGYIEELKSNATIKVTL